MVTTEILKVSEMNGQTLLGQLNGIKNDILELGRNLQPKEPTQYLSRKEVAEMLGIGLVTVSEWTKKGLLQSYKMGNRVFYKRNEVENSLTKVKYQ